MCEAPWPSRTKNRGSARFLALSHVRYRVILGLANGVSTFGSLAPPKFSLVPSAKSGLPDVASRSYNDGANSGDSGVDGVDRVCQSLQLILLLQNTECVAASSSS